MDPELRRWRAEQAALYLDRVRGMGRRVKSLALAIDELETKAAGVRSVDLSRQAVSTSPSSADVADSIDGLVALRDELDAKRRAYEREIAAVSRAIDRMPDATCAALLEMRYVADRTWTECAEALSYTKQGVMSLRQRALCGFYDVMPECRIEQVPPAI